jgi:hypothetical protein
MGLRVYPRYDIVVEDKCAALARSKNQVDLVVVAAGCRNDIEFLPSLSENV